MMVNNGNPNHNGSRPLGGQQQQHHHQRPLGGGHQNSLPRNNVPGAAPMQQQQQRPRQPQPPPGQQRPMNNAVRQGAHPPGQAGGVANRGAPGAAPQAPAPPPPPPVLPKGWKREEIVRTKGITAGLADVVYVPSPTSELSQGVVGKKFRSKLQLQRHFGAKFDVSLLDFRRGKASQVAWRKQRRVKSIQANPSNYQVASKYDNYLNLPARQTVSIFKQPVVTLTNQKNDPTPSHVLNAPNTKSDKPMPTQLFWELRFKGMRPVDASLLNLDGLAHEFESTKLSKFENFDLENERAFMSIAASWYINQNKILVGQSKDFEKNSRIFVDREQPLIPAISVKEEEIKAQESRIQELRKEIKLALQELEEMEMEKLEDMDAAPAKVLTNGKMAVKDEHEATEEEKAPATATVAESIKTEQPIEIDAC